MHIMKKSCEEGGHSFMDYVNPYGQKGTFKAKIYGKKNSEKDKNGYLIKYEQINKRGFYWVPEIQN